MRKLLRIHLIIPPGLFAGLCMAMLNPFASPAFAQVQEQTEVRKDKQATMSEVVYKRLSVIHELMGEGKYAEALGRLSTLEQQKLNAYEKALMYQTYGFVYTRQGDYPRAIPYFESSLGLDSLPNVAQQGMLYSLAGLYTTQEEFQKSIDILTTWFKYEKEPNADAHILMASNYAELRRFSEALPYVRQAISTTEKPEESWYQLELAIYFEEKQYQSATGVLKKLVAMRPEKVNYWDTLSGAYQELNQDHNALATMMLAYQKGLVTTERKLLNIVRMNMFLDLPYQAGEILEREMAEGRIRADRQNLDLLLGAWSTAREFDKAIDVINRVARMTGSGEYYIEMAKLYAEKNEWQAVVDAAGRAIGKGNLKKPGGAYLLMGMAYAELGDFQKALDALEQARGFDETSRRQAEGWIDYVNDRKQIAVAPSGRVIS